MRFAPLASLAAAAALLLPVAALAQSTDQSGSRIQSGRIQAPSSSSSDSKTEAPSKDQAAKGRADAPALLQAAGVRCTMSDATFRGSGTVAGKKSDIYEAACSDGPGFLLISSAGAKPMAYPCLAVADQKTHCVLPANADPKPGLTALATAAGRPCQVDNARYMGASTSTGETYYELSCQGAGGYRLGVPAPPAKLDVVDCLALVGTAQQCTFTTKAQALAGLTPLVKASGRTCAVSDGRFIGTSEATHATYYEVACGPSGGFVIAADGSGKFQRAIDCAQATGIAGGCTLTKVDPAAERARYSQLAAAAGYPCQVNRERIIGTASDGRSVVEVACSNRPDGAIGLFAEGTSGKTEILDCVKASVIGQSCQLTSPSAVYAQYSAALAAKGRSTCTVSNARYIGETGSGGTLIETACSDGKPGWVIYFARGNPPTVKELLNCQQSANDGRPCQLPGNKG